MRTIEEIRKEVAKFDGKKLPIELLKEWQEASYIEYCNDEEDMKKRQEITAGIPLDRLSEICQAEQEGRLHIAPFKNGTPIYYVLDEPFFSEQPSVEEDTYFYNFTEYGHGEINKGWFLTKEAAEAAKEGEKR
jgi:hypothetical protein